MSRRGFTKKSAGAHSSSSSNSSRNGDVQRKKLTDLKIEFNAKIDTKDTSKLKKSGEPDENHRIQPKIRKAHKK